MKSFEAFIGQQLFNEWGGQRFREITPDIICSFYYINTGLQNDQIPEENLQKAVFIIQEIGELYVTVFTQVFIEQLEKYYGTGAYVGRYAKQGGVPRVDLVGGKPEIPIEVIKKATPHEKPKLIARAMTTTYRSDMKRRNDLWNDASEFYMQLAQTIENAIGASKGIGEQGLIHYGKHIGFLIDRLNNAVHHTGGSMMEKLPGITNKGLRAIIDAMNTTHKSDIPSDYRHCVDPEARDIYTHWTGPRRGGNTGGGSSVYD